MMGDIKLTIVFVTNNYKPYQGGVVSSITTHADQLRSLGHRVTIITLDFDSCLPQEDSVIRLYCPIRFNFRTNPIAIPWRKYHALLKLFKTIKPDIIHTHHPFFLAASALKAAKKLNIPIVFTYHTLYEHYLHNIPLPKIISKCIIDYLVNKFCKNVNGIIVPSESVYKQLHHKHIRTATALIPSAISSSFFTSVPTKNLTCPFQLLTVSRFTQEKNIPFLLDVMALLDPDTFHLTLVGYGTELKKLENYAYHHKQLSKVHIKFIERPSKQHLIQLYGQAHIFIFASLSETQGLVLIESMAQKTPVIALDGPGQRDVIINGYNGFLVHSKQEMKKTIQYVSHNKAVHHHLSENAAQTAQNYQSYLLTEKLISFYKKTI